MEWKNYIKGIIFDLDGVIVDTAKYHFKAWKNLASRLGIDFTETENENLKGVSRMESLDYILNLGNISLGQEEKIKLAAEKNEEYLQLISNLNEKEILPGVKEWFQACKEMGIKIALGSASKNARRILNGLSLTDHFEVIVDGTDTSKAKPDPEVFLIAAERLNLRPQQCVVIEDSIKGLEAAEAGGFYSIGIGDPQVLSNTTLVLRDLSERGISIFSHLIEH